MTSSIKGRISALDEREIDLRRCLTRLTLRPARSTLVEQHDEENTTLDQNSQQLLFKPPLALIPTMHLA
jgi:hypothetical protein